METEDKPRLVHTLWDDSEDVPRKTRYAGPPLTNDMKFRKMLAESIGLDKVPDIDPKVFDRIRASWDDCDEELVGTFDVVEAVREVRDW